MKIFKKLMLRSLNFLFNLFNYEIIEKKENLDYYLHEYLSYEQYRDIQIFHNKRKLNSIWADRITLDRVASILIDRFQHRPIKGLCHGTRNGFEQNYLSFLPHNIDAIGTDISETAINYDRSVQWDFHDVNDDWINSFDFVYTNSLDQSWQPKKALTTWLQQLNKNGILIIENTHDHGPKSASEMDPFGVRPIAVPYVLTMWFGSQISISHSVRKKENSHRDAWLYVISKNVTNVSPIHLSHDRHDSDLKI